MLISIIIPCYNSAAYLRHTVDGIRSEFQLHPEYTYQILLVNDCSPDNTLQQIEILCKNDPAVCGIHLAQNKGQSIAKSAAFPFIKGDLAVFMDDDGQHHPRDIFSLIQCILDGQDLVYARFPSMKESPFRRMCSYVNRQISPLISRTPPQISITSFFAVSSYSISLLRTYRSQHPFIGAYLYRFTQRITSIPCEHLARNEGHSNYSLRRLLRLWTDNYKASREIIDEHSEPPYVIAQTYNLE